MGPEDSLNENQEIILKKLPLPEESDAERVRNIKLFCDNLGLILANADLVFKRPEFFYIRHSWMLIGAAYLGSKYIPLGVLLKLWQGDSWIGECPQCAGRAYIYYAGGSPLSGSHQADAVCSSCRETVKSKNHKAFTSLMKEACDLCNRYKRQQKILRTRGPVFSWGKGLVGESLPDKILEDVERPVSLEAMVNELKRTAAASTDTYLSLYFFSTLTDMWHSSILR